MSYFKEVWSAAQQKGTLHTDLLWKDFAGGAECSGNRPEAGMRIRRQLAAGT